MNAELMLDALEGIDDSFVQEAEGGGRVRRSPGNKLFSLRRAPALAAAAAGLLALCGFAAYQLGWFDPWLQTPSADPVETVRSAIENQLDKDYTLSVRVEEITVDQAETARVRAMYAGSRLAEARGWTDQDLAERFVVVRADYDVEYDHTKTFMDDGHTRQYFYLIQDTESGAWAIVDNTSPHTGPQ